VARWNLPGHHWLLQSHTKCLAKVEVPRPFMRAKAIAISIGTVGEVVSFVTVDSHEIGIIGAVIYPEALDVFGRCLGRISRVVCAINPILATNAPQIDLPPERDGEWDSRSDSPHQPVDCENIATQCILDAVRNFGLDFPIIEGVLQGNAHGHSVVRGQLVLLARTEKVRVDDVPHRRHWRIFDRVGGDIQRQDQVPKAVREVACVLQIGVTAAREIAGVRDHHRQHWCAELLPHFVTECDGIHSGLVIIQVGVGIACAVDTGVLEDRRRAGFHEVGLVAIGHVGDAAEAEVVRKTRDEEIGALDDIQWQVRAAVCVDWWGHQQRRGCRSG